MVWYLVFLDKWRGSCRKREILQIYAEFTVAGSHTYKY